ncbi:MAG: P-loop NTPase fold protein [Sphingomonadaceae bacterium]
MAEDDIERAIRRVILSDAPGESDDFSGGGHARTAAALARAIKQADCTDQAIGLEGSWGSGKSTIVRLAEQELKQSGSPNNYKVFTYDLWANQTGHFRRSFLESFLDWSIENFPKSKKFIKEKRDQVSDRIQNVTTKSYRQFNWFSFATLIFLYFSPLIYVWLSPSGFRDANGDPSILLGAKLAWLALGIFLVTMIVAIWRDFPSGKSFWSGLQEAFSRVVSVFSKEAEDKRVTQNIRDEDPTQYEFHRIFRSIIKEVQGSADRVVIVFDNIDRLPSNKIPDIWSDFRGAFYGGWDASTNGAAITAIVPYARPITLEAFGSGGPTEGRVGSSYDAADVFRKSFDVVFTVPQPVLSDTAAYFTEKMRAALGDQVSQETLNRVYRIFDLHIEKSGFPITPRRIVSFINDISNWWEQWQGSIALETISVFVAHQDALLSNPTSLRTADVIDARMIRHSGQSDIHRDLAALAFNVDANLAFQILLNEPIKRALTASDGKQLQELANSASANGFFEILPRVVDANAEDWAANSLDDFCSAVQNLSSLEVSASESAYARGKIVEIVRNLEPPPLAKWGDYPKLWSVFRLATDAELSRLSQTLIAKIAKGLPEQSKQTFEHGRQWIKAIGALLDAVEASHGRDERTRQAKRVSTPGGAVALIGAAYDCDQTSCHISEFAKIGNIAAVAESLEEYAKGGEQFGYAWPELDHLFTRKQIVQLIATVSAAIEQESLQIGSDELNWRFEILEKLLKTLGRSGDTAQAVPASLYTSGAITHYGYAAKEKAGTVDDPVVALTISLVMMQHALDLPAIPNVQGLPVFGNVQPADQWLRSLYSGDGTEDGLAQRIAALSVAFGQVDAILANACEEGTERDLFKSVAQAIYQREDARPPKASLIYSSLQKLEKALDEQGASMFAAIGKESDASYWTDLTLKTLPKRLLAVAIDREGVGWTNLIARTDELLGSLGSEDWENSFRDGGKTAELLATRNKKQPLKLSANQVYEPLLTNCLEVISGQTTPEFSAESYEALFRSLPPATSKKFPKDLFERHSVHSEGIGSALKAFPTIIASMPFSTNCEATVERYLIPLIRISDTEADEFILAHGAEFQKCLSSVAVELKDVVSEALTHESDEEAQIRVDKIRAALKLEPLARLIENEAAGSASPQESAG